MIDHVFAYWEGDDRTPIAAFVAEWGEAFAGFRVYGDDDVVPALERQFPGRRSLYERIRLPAAKADLARLLLLYEHGGLYVDCHCHIGDVAGVNALLDDLSAVEAIFVRRLAAAVSSFSPPGEALLMNGAQASRPGFVLVREAARRVLENLSRQEEAERAHGFVDYDLTTLTGGELLTEVASRPTGGPLNCNEIRHGFEHRVRVIAEEDSPVKRGDRGLYNRPGRHWSERQQSEPLFTPAATVGA